MRRCVIVVFTGIAAWIVGACQAAPATAQVATVSSVQGFVEHQPSDANAYQHTRVGTKLNPGDRIRTGKRSSVEINYGGASSVRLSESSDFIVTGVNEGDLNQGRALAHFPRGQGGGRILLSSRGVNILAGSTFVVIATPKPDGTMQVEILWLDGDGAVQTPAGLLRLSARQGQSLALTGTEVNTQVVSSLAVAAPPSVFVDLTVDPGLAAMAPGVQVTNQAGSSAQIIQRTETINTQSKVASTTRPDAPDVTVPPPPPLPVELPPLPPPILGPGDVSSSASSTRLRRRGDPGNSEGVRRARPGVKRMGVASPPPLTGAPVEGMQPSYFAPRFDGNLFLFKGNSDARALSVRLREHGVIGGVFWEFAVSPTDFFSFRDNRGRTRTDFTDARVLLRTERWGEFSIGRQRFLKGPVQNTVIGTLMRQGGRDIQDAVVWSPPLGNSRLSLDLAYVVDAFPSGLPAAVSGFQPGGYARLQYQSNYGTFGLSGVRHSLGTRNGVSLDFAVPVIRGELDFYGELGADYFRRDLRTVGVYLPGLYQRSDIDLFVEYTRLNDFRDPFTGRVMPNQFLVRAYKRINRRLSFVAAIDKSGGQRMLLGAGLAVALR